MIDATVRDPAVTSRIGHGARNDHHRFPKWDVYPVARGELDIRRRRLVSEEQCREVNRQFGAVGTTEPRFYKECVGLKARPAIAHERAQRLAKDDLVATLGVTHGFGLRDALRDNRSLEVNERQLERFGRHMHDVAIDKPHVL